MADLHCLASRPAPGRAGIRDSQGDAPLAETGARGESGSDESITGDVDEVESELLTVASTVDLDDIVREVISLPSQGWKDRLRADAKKEQRRDGVVLQQALEPPGRRRWNEMLLPLFMYGNSIIAGMVFVWNNLLLYPPEVQLASGLALAGMFYWLLRPRPATVLALATAAAYIAWCWGLPIAIPYKVAVYDQVEVRAGGAGAALAGSYLLTDQLYAGGVVYKGDDKQPLFLHLHHTPEGRCFWRIASDVTAPNAGMAVKARLVHDCRAHGPGLLVGVRDWRTHFAKHTWRRDASMHMVVLSTPAFYHKVWPPLHVGIVHVLAMLLICVIGRYRTKPQPGVVDVRMDINTQEALATTARDAPSHRAPSLTSRPRA